MDELNILEARSNLSRLVNAMERGAEAEIVIARNGKPVARLVAVRPAASGRRIGGAKGWFIVPENIDTDEESIAALLGA